MSWVLTQEDTITKRKQKSNPCCGICLKLGERCVGERFMTPSKGSRRSERRLISGDSRDVYTMCFTYVRAMSTATTLLAHNLSTKRADTTQELWFDHKTAVLTYRQNAPRSLHGKLCMCASALCGEPSSTKFVAEAALSRYNHTHVPVGIRGARSPKSKCTWITKQSVHWCFCKFQTLAFPSTCTKSAEHTK